MYNSLARYYDRLMKDFPYEIFVKFIHENIEFNSTILELGCGTGNITKEIEKNYNIIGTDISNEMLSIANNKCLTTNFFNHNMLDIIPLNELDCIICMVDGINYMESQEYIINVFTNVYNALKKGGIFLFDFLTIKKINDVFIDHYETGDLKEFKYEWNIEKNNVLNSCVHNLYFIENDFVYHEQNIQFSFETNIYIELLEEIGFEVTISQNSDDLRKFVKAYK